jgi:RNA recognition motif-containing protein
MLIARRAVRVGPNVKEMANKLYVGNLSFSTTNEELQQAFSQAGQVVEAVVLMDKMTGRSRGFGFVTMATQEEATAAVEMFNGKDFGGRVIVVNEARPREERPRSGGFGGGGNF